MENNENNYEETQEENQGEIQEDSQEETQKQDTSSEKEGGEEDTKNWKAEAAKWKAIADRKDKKLQTTETSKKETNTEQSSLTREEAIFFAKGGTEEDLALAKKIAKVEDTSILAAMEDDFYKASIEKRQAEEQVKANSLNPSSGSGSGEKKEKSPGQMTRKEHEEFWKEKMKELS